MKMSKLAKPFLISNLVVIVLVLFGPYRYLEVSAKGIAYYLLCSVILVVGLSLNKISFSHKGLELVKKTRGYLISRRGESFLVLLAVISILAGIVYMVMLMLHGGMITGLGDYRYRVTEIRSNFTRFLEMSLHFSMPVFLISESLACSLKTKSRIIIHLSYWGTGIFFLILGARWSIFYCGVVFCVTRKKKGVPIVAFKGKNRVFFVIIAGVFLLLTLIVVYRLFAIRGNTNPFQQYLNNYGDMEIRGLWLYILNMVGEGIYPIFKIIYYFGHAIINFAYSYSYSNASIPLTWGLGNFQVVQWMLIPFGYSTSWYKEVILSYAGAGSYKTYLELFLADWGKVFAPLMVFLFSIVFSRVERYSDSIIFARTLYPVTWCMLLCAPINGMWVSSSQMDAFILISILAIFKSLGYVKVMTGEGGEVAKTDVSINGYSIHDRYTTGQSQ